MLTKQGEENIYLDISTLEPARVYTKVAYVLDSKSGYTKTESGFYTFYVKDINGNKITARIFNITDFINKGFDVVYLKRKACKMTFTLQVWNGSYSLVLTDIEPYSGALDHSKFLGSVDRASEILTGLEKFLTKIFVGQGLEVKLPHEYVSTSLSSLANGSCGGYLQLLNLVVNSITGFTTVHGIDNKELLKIFYFSQEHYFKHLKRREMFEIVPSSELATLITEMNLQLQGQGVKDIVIDTVLALLEIDKPKHLYANIIYKIFRNNEQILSYIESYKLMPNGSTKRIGDDLLLKY